MKYLDPFTPRDVFATVLCLMVVSVMWGLVLYYGVLAVPK